MYKGPLWDSAMLRVALGCPCGLPRSKGTTLGKLLTKVGLQGRSLGLYP